mmetsp:Transcript_21222/g.63227  ORF Transcript_21222/g.63227 Transcript_21222/m.63227 type:complete len:243 (-) Transcript_21222:4646-5374(-)
MRHRPKGSIAQICGRLALHDEGDLDPSSRELFGRVQGVIPGNPISHHSHLNVKDLVTQSPLFLKNGNDLIMVQPTQVLAIDSHQIIADSNTSTVGGTPFGNFDNVVPMDDQPEQLIGRMLQDPHLLKSSTTVPRFSLDRRRRVRPSLHNGFTKLGAGEGSGLRPQESPSSGNAVTVKILAKHLGGKIYAAVKFELELARMVLLAELARLHQAEDLKATVQHKYDTSKRLGESRNDTRRPHGN